MATQLELSTCCLLHVLNSLPLSERLAAHRGGLILFQAESEEGDIIKNEKLKVRI